MSHSSPLSQVIRRKVVISPEENFEQPFKVTLHKKNKKAGRWRGLTPQPHSPTSLPNLTPQPHSPTSLPNVTPQPQLPTSLPNLTSQPHSPTSLPSLTPQPHSPTSLPNLTPQPHSPTSLPNLTPQPHYPTSLPNLTPQPHSPTSPPNTTPQPCFPTSLPNLTSQPRFPTSLPNLASQPHSRTTALHSHCPVNSATFTSFYFALPTFLLRAPVWLPLAKVSMHASFSPDIEAFSHIGFSTHKLLNFYNSVTDYCQVYFYSWTGAA